MPPKKRPRADSGQQLLSQFIIGAPRPVRNVLERSDDWAALDVVLAASSQNVATLKPTASSLKDWMLRQAQARGFKSIQNMPTEKLRRLVEIFETELSGDPHRLKTLGSLQDSALSKVNDEWKRQAEEKAEELREAERARQALLAEARTQPPTDGPYDAPPLVIDIEKELEAELLIELLAEAVEKDKKIRQGSSTSFSRDCLEGTSRYPQLLEHEIEMYVASAAFHSAVPSREAYSAPPSEFEHVPPDFQHVEWLRPIVRQNPFLQLQPGGIYCRCCRSVVSIKWKGQLKNDPIPWCEVKKRLTDRVSAHLGSKEGEHARLWQGWLSKWKDTPCEAVEVASREDLRKKMKESILNTQQLVVLLHLLQQMARSNRSKESVKESQLLAACFSQEARNFYAKPYNCTSPDIHNQLLQIMEAVTRDSLRRVISSSSCVSIMFDEARNKAEDTYALYVRHLDAEGVPKESLWRVTNEKKSERADCDLPPAGHIARMVLKGYDDVGPNFWQKCRGICTDGCSTMAGAKGGAQYFIRGWKCSHAFWLWCQAHGLNIQALSAAREHPAMNDSCQMVGDTYRLLYRGQSLRARRVFDEEMAKALSAIDSFGYWRHLAIPEVGDTRWVSHEGSALVIIRVLPGLVKTFALLRPDLDDKGRELADAFASPEKLYGVFLLATVCPLLKSFSKVLQSPKFCMAEAPSMRDYYVRKLGVLHRDGGRGFPVYQACWEVISQAGIEGATLTSFEAWHERVAKPYVETLVAKLNCNLAAADVVKHMASYDPRSAAFQETTKRASDGILDIRPVAEALAKVAEWYMQAMEGIPEKCPDRDTPRVFSPVWGETHKTALLSECHDAVLHIHRAGLKDLEDVLAEFRSEHLTVKFPATSKYLAVISILPLSSASCERLFSKMRLISNRLRTLMPENMAQLLFLGVEGAWDEGRGIPFDVCRQYLERFIEAKGIKSGERKLPFATMERYMACVDTVLRWREDLRSRYSKMHTTGTQTEDAAPVVVSCLASASNQPASDLLF